MGLALATIALLLGVLEVAFRLVGFPSWDACALVKEEFWVLDPELGFTYRPGAVVVGATINEQGLRGPVVESPKPPGRTRILFIGDSTAFGLGVSLEESFAHVATAALQSAHPEREFDVVIGAIPGYSAHHSSVMLRRLLPLQPDLVVFYVGAYNDHARARYYRDTAIPARQARLEAGWHRIHVLRAAENLADLSWRSWWRKLVPRTWRARVVPGDFRDLMEEMVVRTREAGARALVVLPPFAESLLERHEILPHYQEALRSVAEATGTASLAIQPLFDPIPPDALYRLPDDDYHPRPRGHRVMGEAIAATVLAEGLLGAGR